MPDEPGSDPPVPWTTALVTGASTGIGEAVARRLAAGGVDLVVVARDEARLRHLAGELADRHQVEVEVLPADLTTPDGVQVVVDRLADPDRSVADLVVNNAGAGCYGTFWESDPAAQQAAIELNVSALVALTRAALARLVPLGRGAVLNVSSVVGDQPSPRHAVYAATKAFVTSFSQGVHEELRGTGVGLTVVLPGFTRTEFQERAGTDDRGVPQGAWMEAADVADVALAATAAGRAVCVPGTVNKVMLVGSWLLPRGARRRAVGVLARRR